MRLYTSTIKIQKQLILCDLTPNFNSTILKEKAITFTEENDVITFENKQVVLESRYKIW